MQYTRRRQDVVSSKPPVITDNQLVEITVFGLRDRRTADYNKPSIPAFGDTWHIWGANRDIRAQYVEAWRCGRRVEVFGISSC